VHIPKFEVKKSDDYKAIFVSGVFGTLTPNEGVMVVYTDRIKPSVEPTGALRLESVERELQVELKMSPQVFKVIALWMMKHVQEYEKRFGEIKLPKPPKGKEPGEALYV